MKKAIYKAWPYLLAVTLVAGLVAAMEGMLSIYTMRAIDAVYSNKTNLFQENIKWMLIMATAIAPVTLALAGFRGLFKRGAILNAKKGYLSRLFQKNINEFQNDNNAKYISVMTNDLNTIENNYIDSLYEINVNLINFIVGVIIVGTVSPYALAMGVGIGVLSTLLSVLISKPLQKHQNHRSELYADFTAYIKEVLSAFHIIKSNDLSDKVRADYFNKSHSIQHKGYVIDAIYTLITGLNRLNFNLAFYALLSVAAYMSIKGQLSIGGVILVITNMEKIMNPLSQLSEFFPKIFGTKKLFERIEDSLVNLDTHEETIDLKGFHSEIELHNVSFGFNDNEVLRKIKLSLKKGGKYLLIGPSGGGKSTLLRLLRKYYTPQEGTLQIDGIDLKDVTKSSYYSHVANVEQQVFLFEDTIRNNLTLYKTYQEEEIFEALRGAGLETFVKNLPLGLDSMIYDNGKNISGGEKSRMTIARALLQKADIIFLDEAFSSLDAATAKEIERTLLLLENITVINVSHVVFDETKRLYDNVITVKNKGIFIKEKTA